MGRAGLSGTMQRGGERASLVAPARQVQPQQSCQGVSRQAGRT
jgi:hypothetical protein